MYVGYYHKYRGFDEDSSNAQVVGSDLDEVKQWLLDEHNLDGDEVKWLGSPEKPGNLFTSNTHPELRITEVEVLD